MTEQAKPANETSAAPNLAVGAQHKTSTFAGSLARTISTAADWVRELAGGRPGAPDRRPGGLFRKYALLLVALVGGALIVNAAIEMYYSYDENRAALVTIQREKAQAAATVIEQFIKEIEGQIGWTTHASFLPGASGLDQRRFDFLRLLRQAPAITEVSYLDAEGHEQLKVSRLALDVVGSGTDYSQDPTFKEAKANKRYVSPVYFRKESEPYLTMAVAGTGRSSGVTVAEVNLKFIWDVVSRIRVGKAGSAYVVDGRGLLIAHPDIGLVLRKTDLSRLPYVAAARRKLDVRQAGQVDEPAVALDRTGQEILTASAPIESLGWLVFVDLPLGEAYQPLYASLLRTVLIVGAGLVLAVLAGLWLAQRMVVPIRALAAGAARIGGGDLDHRIEIRTGDELQALADGFNEMGGRLKNYYANLEQTVELRTRELKEALEQQTATSEVLQIISRSPGELQPVFDGMLENATQICGAEFGLLYQAEGDQFRTVALYGAPPAFAEQRRRNPILNPSPGTALGRVVASRRIVQIADVSAEPAYRDDPVRRASFLELAGARTVVCVPMLKDNEVIGAISIYRQEVRPFTDKQVELLTNFAAQAVIAIENARLLVELRRRTRELQEALEYQTATGEVLNAISRSPTSVQPVFDTIVDSAARLCGALYSNVQLYDGQQLHLMATHSFSSDALEQMRQIYPMQPNRSQLAGRAVLSGESVHVCDVLADPEYLHDLALAIGARAMLSVPMLRDGKPIGVITVSKSEPVYFSERQVELLRTFADQAVIAIENARLFDEVQARTRELQESLEQQTATSEVLSVISRSPSEIAPVLSVIVDTARRLCGADYAVIYQLRDGLYHLAAANGGDEEFIAYLQANPLAPGSSTMTGRVAVEKRTVYIPDAPSDPDYQWKKAAELGHFRTTFGVPLLRNDEVIGVIGLVSQRPNAFSESQVQLVETFADQAVIAIENVRLFEEVQARTRQLQESLDYQTATSEVLSVISRSSFKLEPVLEALIESATRLCGATRGHIFRFDGERLVFAAAHGALPGFVDYLEQHPARPGHGSIAGRAALERRTIHVSDLSAEPDYEYTELMKRQDFRTGLAVPMLREGVLLGVIVILKSRIEPFTARQIELVETFADQAVIAIENVRLFEAEQARTKELTSALEIQTATSEILRVIASSPAAIQPVLNVVVESAGRLCDAYDAIVFLRNGDWLEVRAHYGPIVRDFERLPVNRYWTGGRAVVDRKQIHVHDLAAEKEQFPEGQQVALRLGERTVLSTPLLQKGEAIGVLMIRRTEVRPFSDEQMALLRTFADQAVIAIENVRLFEEVQARTRELQEALEYQTATSEVLNVISRSPNDLKPVLEAIVTTAATLCEAYDAIVLLREGDWLKVATHRGPIPLDFDKFPVVRSWATGLAVTECKPVHVEDLQAAGDEFPVGRAMSQRLGHRTILAVPLMRDGGAIGSITLRRTEVRPFSERQVALLQTFADQAVIAIENVRLFEEVQARTRELQEALEYQTATSEVLKAISRSAFDLQGVLDTLVDTAIRLCGAEQAMVFRRDGTVLRLAANRGYSREFRELIEKNPVKIDRGTAVGRATVEGRTVHVHDVLEDPDYTFLEGQKLGGWRTSLAVPLMREGSPIGAFSLNRNTPRPFTARQIELVETFADQAVIAIENVRLFEEVQARTRELQESLHLQTATADVLKVISRSTFDLAKVLQVLVETAVRLCEADGGTITRQIGDKFVRAGFAGFSDEFIKLAEKVTVVAGRGTLSARALLEAKPVHILDATTDPEYTWPEALETGRFRTGLGVPLMREGVPIGVLSLVRRTVRPFTEKQIEILQTFADQAVIAIENVRLFEAVEAKTRELEEALEYQTATSDVLNVISRSPNALQPVLEAIVTTAGRLCEAEFALMYRLEGGAYRVSAANNADSEFVQYEIDHPNPPGRETLVGRVALERRTVHIPDCQEDPEYKYSHGQRIGKYRSMLGVPLLRDGVAIGVIGMLRKAVKPFSQRQIELVTTFADQAVIAIENVRLFEEVEAKTRELARSVEQLKALSEVGKTISSTLDVEAVLNAMLMHACRLADSGGGAVYVFDEAKGTFELAAGHNMKQDLINAVRSHPIRLGDALIGQCAQRREAVQIEDLEKGPPHPLFEVHLKSGIRALLAVPLLHQHKVIGALIVRRKRPGAFAPETVELLQSFASQSAIAIQNARLFKEIEDKSRQLELASQHKSQFLANMSHELRTPLNAILGYTELIQDGVYGEPSEKIRAVLERVQANGKHLLGLINDVLDLSKIEAGQLTLRIDDYSLHDVVHTVVTATESLAREKKLAIAVDLPKSLPAGRGDERRIAQVLLNLVGNAIKFTDAGGVTIAAAAEQGRFRVSVSDTGPGIPLEEQARIFEEFHQVDSSNTKKKGGTGLGLAIAKRIVELHGGSISVESEPGQGAKFMIELPVRAEQRGAPKEHAVT